MAGNVHPILQAIMQGERDRQIQADEEFRRGYQLDQMQVRRANLERQSKLARLQVEKFEEDIKQQNIVTSLQIARGASEGTIQNVSNEPIFGPDIAERINQGQFRSVPQGEITQRELAEKVEETEAIGAVNLDLFKGKEEVRERARTKRDKILFADKQTLETQRQINRLARDAQKISAKSIAAAKLDNDGFSATVALESVILNDTQWGLYGQAEKKKMLTASQTFNKGKPIAIPSKDDHQSLIEGSQNAAGVIDQLEEFYNEHGDKMGNAWATLLSQAESPFWASVLGGKEMEDYVDKQLRLKGLAIRLWTSVTGEKGRFSETDQKAADRMLFNKSSSVEVNRRNGQKVIQLMVQQAMNMRFERIPIPLRQQLFDKMGIDWLTAGKPFDFSVRKYEKELGKRKAELDKYKRSIGMPVGE